MTGPLSSDPLLTPVVSGPLHVRWLGDVTYGDALGLQLGLQRGSQNHLLLLQHPPIYTMGVRAKPEHLLTDVRANGALLVSVNRGGDVTYHGPGQLVGYPVLTVTGRRGGGMADTAAYVHQVEQLLIDALCALGLPGAGRRDGHAGVWLAPGTSAQRKIAAIGVRIDRGRSLHGFALNVDQRVDSGFAQIVPCGIHDASVTSLAAEGVDVPVHEVAAVVARLAIERWGSEASTNAALAWRIAPSDLSIFSREGSEPAGEIASDSRLVQQPSRGREAASNSTPITTPRHAPAPVRMLGRLSEAGVDSATAVSISDRKPDWMRVKARLTPEFRELKRTVRSLDLVTVCEEAGCPNIYECWSAGTATFMVLGERCTRACGFCLVDTRKPLAADAGEPQRVAQAVAQMGLRHAVITMVARDDLADGGAQHVADTIVAIRSASHGEPAAVEALVSDLQGDDGSLSVLFGAKPDVFNHNIETVLRMQRAVRPSASYARSLSVLARASSAGLTTKSGIIVGMGETIEEVKQTLIDLRAVGVSIVTIGQYLRPTQRHLPVSRWVTPAEFDDLRAYGETLGFAHVEASALTRSSYHAREGAEAASHTMASPSV